MHAHPTHAISVHMHMHMRMHMHMHMHMRMRMRMHIHTTCTPHAYHLQGAPQPALQPVSIQSLGEYVHEQQQQQQQQQLQLLTPKELQQLHRLAADAPWRPARALLHAAPQIAELQLVDALPHDAALAARHAQSQASLEQLEVLAPTPRARRTAEAARRAGEWACAAQPPSNALPPAPPLVPRTKHPKRDATASGVTAAPAAAADGPLLLATSFGYAAFASPRATGKALAPHFLRDATASSERLAVPGALKHPPQAARD